MGGGVGGTAGSNAVCRRIDKVLNLSSNGDTASVAFRADICSL